MKTIVLLITLLFVGVNSRSQASDVTADDVARHLGIHFWKFEAASLPTKYSVTLQEIEDGKITKRDLGGFLFTTTGELVIGISIQDGLLLPTISVGSETWSINEKQRRKIGADVKHSIKKIVSGVPMVICASYKSKRNEVVATGKVEDVVSGLALLILEEKTN